MSISTRYATLRGLWEELDHHQIIKWKDPEDGALYHKQIQEGRIFEFLGGLYSSSKNTCTVLGEEKCKN